MKTQSQLLCAVLKSILFCSVLMTSVLGLNVLAFAAEPQAKVPAAIQVKKSVNINNANAQTLSAVLAGVGIKKAQAIVDWRKKNGKFVKLEQLLNVKGIGEKILAANRGRIQL